MSWDVYLNDDDGKRCQVAPFMGGGTVRANPETMEEIPQVEAELNVTYNYSQLFDLAASTSLYELHLKRSDASLKDHGRSEFEAIAMLTAWYQDGFRSLDSRRASGCRSGLGLMVAQLDPRGLGPNKGDDYWAPTPTNAAAALRTLLGWCHDAPDGTFTVH